MRLDQLIERLLASIAQERVLLRRLVRYVLPLLLLPIGFALAQISRGWLGLATGGLGAGLLLAQIELFLRPTLVRARVIDRDIGFYLGPAATPARRPQPPSLAPVVTQLIPAALAVGGSMALFLPTILATAPAWQRLLALALELGVLWSIWQRLAQVATLLDSVEQRLTTASDECRVPRDEESLRPSTPDTRHPIPDTRDGLLDAEISRRVAGMPLPALPLSPAAQALLRVEAYVLLRDYPDTTERALLDAMAGLAQEAHASELRHWLLPPVGGKLYLPIAANGTLATLLGATARRLGMDGGYSASLGTWLVRLPPARSYAVAGRLIDALLALRLPPPGAILPHHLTIQGDLGQESKVLSLLHLAATPLLFEERPGHAAGDDRPFIMRGGGVLDDMGGRGRYTGPRTDFVDGFVFVRTPGMDAAEHLIAHTVNLRIKQILAFGLLAAARPLDRRAPVEQRAATAYARLRVDLRGLLAGYGLEAALDIRWLDGSWSEVWPLILRMSNLKERDGGFLDAAQRLRDTALDEVEEIAVAATGESRR